MDNTAAMMAAWQDDDDSMEPDDEEVFAADDGSGQDEGTNSWDRITSALEGASTDQTHSCQRILPMS
jgi:hypothetical protein